MFLPRNFKVFFGKYQKLFAVAMAFILLLTSVGVSYFINNRLKTTDTRSSASSYNPATAISEDYSSSLGPVLQHGQTIDDVWGKQGNHPPTDGSVKTSSFYVNGDNIVTKGNTYWLLPNGSNSWTVGDLRVKWNPCNTFPLTGIDAYSINPGNGDEYAIIGKKLYVLTVNKTCSFDGLDLEAHWNATALSPSGEHPLKNYNKIDQFQFLDANTQVYFTGDKMWLVGQNHTLIQCAVKPTGPWKFCNPETLTSRWSSYEKHPPLDKVGLYAVSYSPQFHVTSYGIYLWTLGINNVWDTFQSGYDGYGACDPYIMKDPKSGKYYMYYDASEAYQPWKTAVAVASHPKGPWKKLGLAQFTGSVRSWEKGCSCASTVF